jgi:hypothetical protein
LNSGELAAPRRTDIAAVAIKDADDSYGRNVIVAVRGLAVAGAERSDVRSTEGAVAGFRGALGERRKGSAANFG